MTAPELVAHRGYARHYPENTLTAVEAAIAAGARFVEVDVQLSSDEVPVLFHDRTLQRVCGAAGAVHDYTAAELKRFKAMEFDRFGYRFANERIATLAELAQCLQRYPHVTAFIEIKRASLQRFGPVTVLHRIRRDLEAVQTQCVLISFDLDVLSGARPRWPTIGAVIENWRERKQYAIAALKPEYLFCNIEGVPAFGRLTFGDSRVVIYEVDDPALARKLHKRGAAMIETFAVGEMRDALG